jgi:hypothetical protein
MRAVMARASDGEGSGQEETRAKGAAPPSLCDPTGGVRPVEAEKVPVEQAVQDEAPAPARRTRQPLSAAERDRGSHLIWALANSHGLRIRNSLRLRLRVI